MKRLYEIRSGYSGITPGIEVEFAVDMRCITELADFKFKDCQLLYVLYLDLQLLAVGEVVNQGLDFRDIYVVG